MIYLTKVYLTQEAIMATSSSKALFLFELDNKRFKEKIPIQRKSETEAKKKRVRVSCRSYPVLSSMHDIPSCQVSTPANNEYDTWHKIVWVSYT